MPLNIAGKPLSNGSLAVSGGLVVGLIDSFLAWHSTSFPAGYVCTSLTHCGYTTTVTGSHTAFGYWSGDIFFIAALVGLALFVLRTFVPQVTIPPLPFTDAMIYAGIGVVMLLCALLWLVTGGGYAQLYAGYSSGPSYGLFIGIIAAVAVGVGGYLMRLEPQPTIRPLSSYQSPPTSAAPPAPPAPPPAP